MKRIAHLIVFLFAFPMLIVAQNTSISGSVRDDATAETLIGVNIQYAEGQGTITDVEGNFSIVVPNGAYTLRITYVGYKPIEMKIDANGKSINLDLSMETTMLTEVQVVADVAKTRETPVAFTTILPAKLDEELASQDLPMMLNKTPGVYATQQGGGDGDARINIRGFNQRNIAVMIDGIPVNDMENGWVYWSNWFGLDAVTRSVQVQRGLGASKLSIPSVGGTMNIISKGIDAKRGLSVKQEVGNDGFYRTSLGFTSGQLKNGWGITAAGSYKRGDGWVDMNWTEGYFYFFRVDKRIGKHLISLTGMGAPQKHGQRSYTKAVGYYDAAYASELGVDTASLSGQYYVSDRGYRFNEHWGYLTRADGMETRLNEKMNFYHKPQFSLRDFWNVNDKLYISNILYASFGNGGGTGTATSDKNGTPGSSSFATDYETGLINFQAKYDKNSTRTPDVDNERRSSGILRASMNNHQWYGLLSTANYRISKKFEFSGGADLRYYRGEHYMQVYDLLGGDYFLDNSNTNDTTLIKKREGDIIRYHNDGLVGWGGLFGQLQYKTGRLTSFLNLTVANTNYQRVDYFKFAPGEQATEWRSFWGQTAKLGANYNLSKKSNVFANIGYISKAPRFNNVFYYDNIEFTDPKNEKVKAAELGYSYYNRNTTININTYVTSWKNKPADRVSSYTDPINDETYQLNINGMSALHLGVELEAARYITKQLKAEIVVSVGDWKWTSEDSARLYANEQFIKSYYFNAQGVHVGDAAQFQSMLRLRWEPVKGLYFGSSATYFSKHYAQFDPFSLSPESGVDYLDEDGNPKDSWVVPTYYLVDVNAGYKFSINKVRMEFRASVINLLDRRYISDAVNNDSYSVPSSYRDFDAKSAGVFFGLGRRFNTSLKIII